MEFIKLNFKLNNGDIATTYMPEHAVQKFIDMLGKDKVWTD